MKGQWDDDGLTVRIEGENAVTGTYTVKASLMTIASYHRFFTFTAYAP